ncbi:MAG TPA: alpha/beta fold hydrolase, partial [Solirubrobacterales bacterium]|nr:alpha/beta fold hydrolase [Solirubrobacterales bacterium]
MPELPPVDGVSHRTVRARGLDFHVAEAGSGDDVVLCLHGWPQHWYEWRHLMPALADRHRVLALDLRGFGWSEAPPKGYEKENLASDVLAVLDQLGIERVKLVGHDWGGWVGFLLCLHGWPQHWYEWRHLMPALAGKRPVQRGDDGRSRPRLPPIRCRRRELASPRRSRASATAG